jgi:negative regulator of sigma-B (phosphoserine phosphatase)
MEVMSTTPETGSRIVEWGVGARTFAGEVESGDLHLVALFPGGVLIAVVDGLGHGPEAATASRAAVAALQICPSGPPIDLAQRCHVALQKTRGVVLSLASIDASTHQMTWLGIGNVDGMLFRREPAGQAGRESLPTRGGVVGYHMPVLRAVSLPIAAGDTLVFASDGIRSSFSGESPVGCGVQDAADHIVTRYAKSSDDALVLVARYLGAPP